MENKNKKSLKEKLETEQQEFVDDQLETEKVKVENKRKSPLNGKKPLSNAHQILKKIWVFLKENASAVQITIIILLFGLTAFSGLLFPRSGLARFIDGTIGQFFDVTSILRDNYLRLFEAVGIIVFIWALHKILQLVIDNVFGKRIKNITAFLLVKKLLRWALIFAAVFMVLTTFGVNSTAIVASVGIIGLVVSFGAQKLVEDIISGLFLIVEKQFQVGDIVIISDYRGVIEEIGLRTTKVVDAANLDIKIINNSDIRNVINLSVNISTAICEMSIEYGASIPEIEDLVNPFLLKIKEKYPEIIDGPNYLGVQDLGDSDVVLRYVAKTLEADKFKIQRAMKRELKIFFDENGIGIPFPQLVIHKAE